MDLDFFERIDQLAEQVGFGVLTMTDEVDQVYAAPQERGFWETGPNAGVHITHHPRGGQQDALRDSLLERTDEWMQTLADGLITTEGSDLRHAASDVAEGIAKRYALLAPIDVGDLRVSSHPTVTDDGAVVYDRPPLVPRLSRDQLKAKSKHRLRHDIAKNVGLA